jgi:DNA-binding beta-propeller fold protein YncE
VISFNKETNQIQDGKIQLPENIVSTAYAKDGWLVIYDGSGLLVWDTNKNKAGVKFSSFLPDKDALMGLKYFSTNSRVYVIDKTNKQAISFLINNDQISRPVIAVKDAAELGQAEDFAIDGSIYVLTSTSVKKFLSGKLVEFNFPFLFKSLSGKGKIYTEAGLKYIYLLDSGNNRILIIDKKGNINQTLVSNQFNKMVDFTVEEKNKTIYVLNDSGLLKVTY